MKNVKYVIEENGILSIEVDLKEEFGRSSSGKTIIIATVGKPTPVEWKGKTYFLGLNVFRYPNQSNRPEEG